MEVPSAAGFTGDTKSTLWSLLAPYSVAQRVEPSSDSAMPDAIGERYVFHNRYYLGKTSCIKFVNNAKFLV
jgi:hypothetical protein